MVEFNTTEGEIGVLPGHIPLTVIIKPGILDITESDGDKVAALHAGFAEILPDRVTRRSHLAILAEIVEWPDEIDESRATAAKERAEQRLHDRQSSTDVARAELALQRAIVRIEALK